jgi:hypothetical protein
MSKVKKAKIDQGYTCLGKIDQVFNNNYITYG